MPYRLFCEGGVAAAVIDYITDIIKDQSGNIFVCAGFCVGIGYLYGAALGGSGNLPGSSAEIVALAVIKGQLPFVSGVIWERARSPFGLAARRRRMQRGQSPNSSRKRDERQSWKQSIHHSSGLHLYQPQRHGIVFVGSAMNKLDAQPGCSGSTTRKSLFTALASLRKAAKKQHCLPQDPLHRRYFPHRSFRLQGSVFQIGFFRRQLIRKRVYCLFQRAVRISVARTEL